jgi:hypothetical protein
MRWTDAIENGVGEGPLADSIVSVADRLRLVSRVEARP